jgi:hypothetical protein
MGEIVSAVEAIEKAMEGVTHPDAPAWISVAQDGNGPNGGFWTCAAATTESPRYIRADLVRKMQDELAVARSVHRWNVDRYGENLAVCRNEHDKCDPCEWETFVPIARAVAAARKAEALQQEVAEKDARIAALEAGMLPFAKVADELTQSKYGPAWGFNNAIIEHEDFRRARTLLNGGSDAQG